MKRAGTGLNLKSIALGSAILAGCALTMTLALAALSKPGDYSGRVARLEQKLTEAQRLESGRRGPAPAALGSVCQDGPALQAAALRQDLESAARPLQLALSGLTISEEEVEGVGGRLRVLELRFSSAGPYDALVNSLAKLADRKPTLFIDRLDIIPSDDAYTLELEGRLYCAV